MRSRAPFSPDLPLRRLVPGAIFTPMALALAAWTALEQERSDKVLHVTGFSTPAAAFHQTYYWDRLLERCREAWAAQRAVPCAWVL